MHFGAGAAMKKRAVLPEQPQSLHFIDLGLLPGQLGKVLGSGPARHIGGGVVDLPPDVTIQVYSIVMLA